MVELTDYIIIGAGSAGCVLAERLSESGRFTVLVIESGPDDKNPFIDMPRGIGKLLVPGNPHISTYEIDKGGNHGPDVWMKGRAIGGSSSINGMVYVRGFPSDYDRWAEAGCPGWSWADMLPHLKANEAHEFGASDFRGDRGPLRVSAHPAEGEHRLLGEAVLAAAAQAGLPTVDDTNAHPEGGLGWQPRNIWKGKRQSAAKAFLRPAMQRPNVTVWPDTQVLKIDFENRRASGVRLRRANGETATVRANREIILSAGAIESPKLLQLSGVGPGALLSEHGIEVVHDQPNVGGNLREHVYITCNYRVTRGSLNREFQGVRLLGNVIRYYLSGAGPMAHAAQEMIGYIRSRDGLARPDCQIGIGFYSMKKGRDNAMVLDTEPGLTMGGYHMHTQSRGEIRIASADPSAAPYILGAYMQHEEDRAATIAMMRYIRNIAAQPALKDFIDHELAPGAGVQDDAELLHDVMTRGGTAFHVSGTCRMGSDDGAVVDPRTRVNGVTGLRVVDTSIFPELPSGNTNAPAMAAGRNAAAMILADA